MSQRSVIRSLVGVALSLLGVAACGGDKVGGPPATLPDSLRARLIVVQPTAATLNAGDTIRFTGTVMDSSGLPMRGVKVKWSSMIESVLTIDSTGLAHALASVVGTTDAIVAARYYTLQSTATVTVKGAAIPPKIFAWPDTNVLYPGMTRSLRAQTDNANSPVLVSAAWQSSDPSVVSVSDSGQISAVSSGHAQITALYKGQTTTADIYVLAAPPPLRFTVVTGGTSPGFEGAGGPGGCGLTTDGSLYCWGTAFPEMEGPFDRCETRDKIGPSTFKFTRFRCSEIPRQVPTTLRFTSLTHQSGYGCAVATSGVVYCWGGNGFGQLGIGATDPLQHGLTPISSSDKFQAVSGQYSTHCALRLDGAVFCWGLNIRGDAGVDPAVDYVTSPTRLSTAIKFRSLSPGGNCGIAVDSTAYCWGSHVGDSTYANCQSACSPTPIQMGGTRYVTMASVGTYCGLTSTGRANCWGYHGLNPYDLSAPTAITSDVSFVSLGSTSLTTIVALTAAGDLYELSPNATPNGYSVRPIDAGGMTLKSFSRSCGIATDGKAYCWDALDYGYHTVARLLAGQ